MRGGRAQAVEVLTLLGARRARAGRASSRQRRWVRTQAWEPGRACGYLPVLTFLIPFVCVALSRTSPVPLRCPAFCFRLRLCPTCPSPLPLSTRLVFLESASAGRRSAPWSTCHELARWRGVTARGQRSSSELVDAARIEGLVPSTQQRIFFRCWCRYATHACSFLRRWQQFVFSGAMSCAALLLPLPRRRRC